VRQVRSAIGSLSSTLYSDWRELQDSRRKQGFASTAAYLTARRIERQGRAEGSDGDHDEGADSGEERRYRRDRRARGRDEETLSGGSTARSKSSTKNGDLPQGADGWSRLRAQLPSVCGILDKVRDLFLRDAVTAEEMRIQEIQDHMASSASLTSGLSRSGRELLKKRNPHSMSRSLLELGGEGVTPPVGSEDEQNAYIALGLPVAAACVAELLRGPPGQRGEEGGYTAGSGSGSGGHSLLPEYVLRLSEDGQVTAPTQLSAQEIHRRRLLADTKYKVVLIVNGRAVTHSEPVELRFPSLTADFKQFFELRLIHEPTDLSVDIYGVSGGVIACLTKGERL
jgi:CC2D2A N-terminal C2 domain